MARYEKGETLASIARTYDCSPPAISYIVSRSKARQPAAEIAAPPAEPQLIKAHPEPASQPNGGAAANVAAAPAPEPGWRDNGAGPGGNGSAPDRNGFAPHGNGAERMPGPAAMSRPAPPRPGPTPQPQTQPLPFASVGSEQRRTLHLALGGMGANGASGAANGGNGHAAPADPPPAQTGARPPAAPFPPPPQAAERPEPRQPLPPRYGHTPGERGLAEPGHFEAETGKRRDGGNFIDRELRARVDADIAAFLAAFDAALADDTIESRAGLREATDRLLRAGARTRIELERLEARVPLSSRAGESGGRPEAHWRHR